MAKLKVVAPVRAKATPVILSGTTQMDASLTGSVGDAVAMQVPEPIAAVRVVEGQ